MSILGNIGGVYFLDALANHTTFIGAAVGGGGMKTLRSEAHLSGSGLHAKLSAGYEMFRASTMRALVQAEIILPFYSLKTEVDNVYLSPKAEREHVPVFGVTFGIAVARLKQTITVRRL